MGVDNFWMAVEKAVDKSSLAENSPTGSSDCVEPGWAKFSAPANQDCSSDGWMNGIASDETVGMGLAPSVGEAAIGTVYS